MLCGIRGSQLSSVTEDQKLAIKLSEIEAATSDATERLRRLEDAILPDPARAIEAALLREDLESMESRMQAHHDDASEAIDRVYDQNKWLIALVITVILSVVPLVLGSLKRAQV